ncbi:hypothetical protein B0H12DRAFT_1268261 [Mycena haematopus]|nr:hypothetical protein B0H12DRAFT_1268261 [Mycena haematopus]
MADEMTKQMKELNELRRKTREGSHCSLIWWGLSIVVALNIDAAKKTQEPAFVRRMGVKNAKDAFLPKTRVFEMAASKVSRETFRLWGDQFRLWKDDKDGPKDARGHLQGHNMNKKKASSANPARRISIYKSSDRCQEHHHRLVAVIGLCIETRPYSCNFYHERNQWRDENKSGRTYMTVVADPGSVRAEAPQMWKGKRRVTYRTDDYRLGGRIPSPDKIFDLGLESLSRNPDK